MWVSGRQRACADALCARVPANVQVVARSSTSAVFRGLENTLFPGAQSELGTHGLGNAAVPLPSPPIMLHTMMGGPPPGRLFTTRSILLGVRSATDTSPRPHMPLGLWKAWHASLPARRTSAKALWKYQPASSLPSPPRWPAALGACCVCEAHKALDTQAAFFSV